MGLALRAAIDSDGTAAHLQRLLLLPRGEARDLATQTIQALELGRYRSAQGALVEWGPQVAQARAAARSLPPDAALPQPALPGAVETEVTVANRTSLDAALRRHGQGRVPLVLNMANGVTPGGGFRGGARAQEEYLCRNSALYATLAGDPMYDAHHAQGGDESSDWAILSPGVPVFRDDRGAPLEQTWLCSFITCAAPVAHTVGQPRSGLLLRDRIHRVLAIAAAHGFSDLVMGAWGCGAFGNDPARTARDFFEALDGPFEGRFRSVEFAIADWSPERRFLGPFRDTFAADADPGEGA